MNPLRDQLKHMFYWMTCPVLSGPLKGCRMGLFTGTKFILGKHGAEEAALLREHIRPGDVVFDAGAHIGYMTMLAAKAAGETGRVYAFEPLPLNLRYLRRHIAINHLATVQILPCAIGRTAGEGAFDLGKGSGRGNLNPNATGQVLRVQIVSLDELVAAGKLPLPNVVKMDIEGAELDALQGAAHIFTTARPRLFLSTHGPAIRAGCEALLKDWNYEITPIPDCDLMALPC
jgi:FkbM family methyltransferase